MSTTLAPLASQLPYEKVLFSHFHLQLDHYTCGIKLYGHLNIIKGPDLAKIRNFKSFLRAKKLVVS